MNINFINHKLRTNVKTSVKILKLRTRTKRKNFFLTKILKTSALIVKKNYKKHNFFLLRSLIFHNFLFNNYYKKKIETRIKELKTAKLNSKSKKFFFRKEKKRFLKKRSKFFNRFKKPTNLFINKIKKLKKNFFFNKMFFSNFLVKNRIFFSSKLAFRSLDRTEKRKKKLRNFNWRIKYSKILKRKKSRNFFYLFLKILTSRNVKKKYNKLNSIFQKDYLSNDFLGDDAFFSLFFFFKKQNFNFLTSAKNLLMSFKFKYHLFIILQKPDFFLNENNFFLKFKTQNYFKNFFLFYFNKNFNVSSSILKINAIGDFKNFKNQHLFSFLKKKSILINKNFFLFSNFLTFPNVSSSFFKESESSLFIDTFLYTKNLTQKTKKLLKLKNKIKKSKTVGLSQKFILPNCFLKRVFKVMFKKSYFVKNFKSFLFFFFKTTDETKVSKILSFFFSKKKKNSFVNTRKIKNFLLCDLNTKNTFFTKKVFFNDFLIGKNNNKKSLTFFFSTFRNDVFFFFTNPFFFKSYYFFIFKSFLNTSYLSFFYSLIRKDENVSFFQNANIFPEKSIFSFNVTREVIQNMDYSKIQSFFSYLPYETIIKFIEHCSGKKVAFKIDPFVMKSILPEDNSRCFMWSHRIKVFRKNLGPRLFLVESLQILTLCFRLKDPYVLSNWMLSMFYKISFWKYKMFFRYIQYILRNFFWPYFSEYGIKGVRFQLKGKVSVAGNARTRTIFAKIGSLSHSTYKYKILTHLNLLRTFTGVIGFRTWLIF